jgi:IS5 family transposase
MMVRYRKGLSDEDLRRINEMVVERSKEMVLEEPAQTADDDQENRV